MAKGAGEITAEREPRKGDRENRRKENYTITASDRSNNNGRYISKGDSGELQGAETSEAEGQEEDQSRFSCGLVKTS